MSKARNQHWLPQFYLRYFAVSGYRRTKNAKIWLADFETNTAEEKKVAEVAAAEFLYSHVRSDGSRSYEVEDRLGKLESIVSNLYPRIAEGYPDLAESWGIKKFAAVFVASLMLRHPSMEEQNKETHRRMIEAYSEISTETGENTGLTHLILNGVAHPFDDSNFEEYRNADNNDMKKMFAEQIHPLAIELSDHLFKKRWIFLFTESPAFFTSDTPSR
jgi:hypothetical protein